MLGRVLHYRFALGLIIGGTIAFALGAFTAKAFFARKQIPNSRPQTPFLTQGFDFNPLRSADNEWRGPDIGEKIDLTRLKTRDGKTLASRSASDRLCSSQLIPIAACAASQATR